MRAIKVLNVCKNWDGKDCLKCDEPEPCDSENCADCDENCMMQHEASELECPRYGELLERWE